MSTTKTKEMLVNAIAPMDDLAIATDMLLSAKSAVRTYAIALTETATPKVHKVLKAQLDTAIETHQKIAAYMIENEMYHPYDLNEQIDHDHKKAETALELTK
ncbi:spore coat protein [Paenibacillus sp. PK3_47]|uniref:spore coat protein n=1 Tax=Paenibacillus sp. PK3_47 TaxID=2072642 RepID=UPI00201E0C9B|nr:spore coat protein [Paenibacillus sp. PK3_47]UQZ32684.1 spore coat protein [Paenibacillus sp. PK3_47]